MTDNTYTHLLVVVDRSGSMVPVANDMIGGMDAFFAEQAKVEGKCLVDYAQFDTEYELVHQDVPVADVKAVLEPRGATALLDAIGKSVTTLGRRFAKMDESKRPGKVIVVVVTDGMENSSREWTAESVKGLVKQQEDQYAWDFVFLGANMDAVDVGTQYGFGAGKSLTYDTNNTYAMSASLSNYTTRSRVGDAAVNAFTDSEREAQKA